MARRNEHSREELREMALAAAEALLDSHGSDALSTRKIAAAIGYSAGSLYQVFNNYDDLCWQLNQRTLRRLLKALETTAVTPAMLLQQYASRYLAFAQQWPQRWSLLFEHSAPLEQTTPVALENAIAELFVRIEQPLMALFPEQTADVIANAARTLWAGVHGIAVLQAHNKLFQTQPDAAPQMAEELICRYLVGWTEEIST